MRRRGFSLVEMLVVVIAIGILAGFALDRLLPLLGQAERIAFIRVRGQLQSTLLLEAASRIAAGERDRLAELTGNPMELLLEAPDNYLGVIERADLSAVPGRHWYYDDAGGRLVYRVGRYARFDGLDGPADRIELAVRLAFEDRDGDGTYDAASDPFHGLRLVSLHAFSWPE